MSPSLDELPDQLRGAWRFRWLALIAACVLAAVGWIAVLALPDVYEAAARLFVDTRTVLRPALQGLAVEQESTRSSTTCASRCSAARS